MPDVQLHIVKPIDQLLIAGDPVDDWITCGRLVLRLLLALGESSLGLLLLSEGKLPTFLDPLSAYL